MEYIETYKIEVPDGLHMRPCMRACDFMEKTISENEGLEFILEKENGDIWRTNPEPSFMILTMYAADLTYGKSIQVTTSGNFLEEDLKKYNEELGKFFR